jgi:hypothetical protein
MNPTIDRLKLFFLAVFAVGTVGVWAYQIFYVWPAKTCDNRGGWWDRQMRICATPIYVPSITGRPVGVSRKAWSERQAALQAQRDREGYPALAESGPSAKPVPAAPKLPPK